MEDHSEFNLDLYINSQTEKRSLIPLKHPKSNSSPFTFESSENYSYETKRKLERNLEELSHTHTTEPDIKNITNRYSYETSNLYFRNSFGLSSNFDQEKNPKEYQRYFEDNKETAMNSDFYSKRYIYKI